MDSFNARLASVQVVDHPSFLAVGVMPEGVRGEGDTLKLCCTSKYLLLHCLLSSCSSAGGTVPVDRFQQHS